MVGLAMGRGGSSSYIDSVLKVRSMAGRHLRIRPVHVGDDNAPRK